ncbi:MAG: HIT family protein [Candidatus Levybacteria bacterium]|nr:HIT family protein [Candidatus Levybacteria bacterium]
MEENCIFCKLVRKEVPVNVVFENDDVLSFLELNQSVEGHVMVILKKHGKSIFDYDEKDLGKLMSGVSKVSKKVQKALTADSLTIGINHLEKQGVPHLHIHIIPRHENDKGGIIQSIVRGEVKRSREEITQMIINAN